MNMVRIQAARRMSVAAQLLALASLSVALGCGDDEPPFACAETGIAIESSGNRYCVYVMAADVDCPPELPVSVRLADGSLVCTNDGDASAGSLPAGVCAEVMCPMAMDASVGMDADAGTPPDATSDASPDSAPDAEPDTAPDTAPTPEDEVCDDGIDNDLDGALDCEDRDCHPDPLCCEAAGGCERGEYGPGAAESEIWDYCTDGLDMDMDGFSDCDDSDCYPWCGPYLIDEEFVPICDRAPGVSRVPSVNVSYNAACVPARDLTASRELGSEIGTAVAGETHAYYDEPGTPDGPIAWDGDRRVDPVAEDLIHHLYRWVAPYAGRFLVSGPEYLYREAGCVNAVARSEGDFVFEASAAEVFYFVTVLYTTRDVSSYEVAVVPVGEESCEDGVDNDRDGLIDCLDPECCREGACVVSPEDLSFPTYPNTLECNGSEFEGAIRVGQTIEVPVDAYWRFVAPLAGSYVFRPSGGAYGEVFFQRTSCIGGASNPNALRARFDAREGEVILLHLARDDDGDIATQARLDRVVMETCDNFHDDDRDGLYDCEDPDCEGAPGC